MIYTANLSTNFIAIVSARLAFSLIAGWLIFGSVAVQEQEMKEPLICRLSFHIATFSVLTTNPISSDSLFRFLWPRREVKAFGCQPETREKYNSIPRTKEETETNPRIKGT
jgi:hypothetical protein